MKVSIVRYRRLSWPKDNPKKKRRIYVAEAEDGRTGVGQTVQLRPLYTEEQLRLFWSWMAEKWGK